KKKKIFDNRYEVLSIIGRGARSVVYHARYIDGDKEEVALKVLLDKKDGVPPSDLLRKEALAMVSSRHKYVIRLDDFHSLGDICYLTMEYAPLGDLRQLLNTKGGKLSHTQTELFLLQASEALDFVHKAGILHRDLKPENILVIDEQNIRIGDFGVAILPGEKSSLEELQNGVGTLDYLSPEVLEGQQYDKRSDLYALGITFYELLTGKHPFQNVPLAEQIEARRAGNFTAVSEHAPSAPGHLLSAIQKLMRFDPNERFQTARELIQSLISFDVSGLSEEENFNATPPHSTPSTKPSLVEPPPLIEDAPIDPIEDFPFEQLPIEEPIPATPPTQANTSQESSQPSAYGDLTPEELADLMPEPGPMPSSAPVSHTPSPPENPITPPMQEPPRVADTFVPEEPPMEQYENFSQQIEPEHHAHTEYMPPPESEPPFEPKPDRPRKQKSGSLLNAKKTSSTPMLLVIGALLAIGLLYFTSSIFGWIFPDSGDRPAPQDTLPLVQSEENNSRQGSRTSSEDSTGLFPAEKNIALTNFPQIPGGVYSGFAEFADTGKRLPFSIIAVKSSRQLIIAIGIPGVPPMVVDLNSLETSGEEPLTIRAASQGLIISIEGTVKDGTLTGTLRNEVTGETASWVVQQ
ncbi:MAG: protein kinase, partial [Bdellovibrionales bacterium]|nr:protein kinase [Bdellovibrionales bacterium]